ncbi:sulfate ABC transporter substrate-binding protein [Blastococcus sp. TF02-8]|uniref:sulfate ABC transporter substrate-binding protein n=1 Tax=Blastococcus sp. TF02-8 TaxID=2250574 RepID=UPI000DEBD86D|nr:sulfate ABC transporter substrate-binding protein [Blastococcus sp. TF02-8]RBY97122.1 sulfate ABC transporter substrate-binding protein [Blastococcus sp. TF02-8]
MAAGTIALLGLTACGGDGGSSSEDTVTLALVAYSTPQEAYEQIITAFQKTDAGRNVEFTTSFGGSGDQSRAVEAGQPADVVAFSLEPDMTRLVKADLVAADWNSDEHAGMVTDSVVVIATREGNPEDLTDWADLTGSGVEVITPNPFTSGGARWNVLAAYGAASDVGKDEQAGVAYLNDLFANVPVQDDSARKALQTFAGGKGDAMLAYENEAIFAQQNGQKIDYTVPDETLLIENPVAVTKSSKHPEEAQAFLDFLRSEEAQQIFVDNGYRPVDEDLAAKADFPQPSGLFTIADLGGWADVTSRFFDTDSGLMVDVERSIGVAVEN